MKNNPFNCHYYIFNSENNTFKKNSNHACWRGVNQKSSYINDDLKYDLNTIYVDVDIYNNDVMSDDIKCIYIDILNRIFPCEWFYPNENGKLSTYNCNQLFYFLQKNLIFNCTRYNYNFVFLQ